MARRKQSGDVNIGSDSFLDVIANIVGILIILIVIAGVRVSRAPVIVQEKLPSAEPNPKQQLPPALEPIETATPSPSLEVTQNPTVAAEAEPITAEIAPEPAPDENSLQMAEVEVQEEPLEPEFVESTKPSQELVERMRQARKDLNDLNLLLEMNSKAIREIEEQQAQGRLRIASQNATLNRLRLHHVEQKQSTTDWNARLASQQSNLEQLKSQVAQLGQLPPKVKTLKHRVTPISRVVVANQVHFRLSENRVSVVPIDELLEAAMRQAKRHGQDLAQSRTRIGTVGPVGGYLLQYKLQAVPASTSEQARFGPGIMRIALTSFQLEPDSNVVEESAERALTKGSAFDIAMQTAEEDATFTMWVYPDSFPLYRQLRDRLHENGRIVAGRPIPKGVPIAGSPNGTASEGQ